MLNLRRVQIPGPDTVAADGTRLADALCGEDVLLVRSWGRDDLVIASPHHAPKGVPDLYPGRLADENAGLVVDRVAEALGARGVIVCHARSHDPNKVDGPYLDEVLRPPLAALVEIHGHQGVGPSGPRQRARHDVELSTGSLPTQALAEALAGRLVAAQQALAEGRKAAREAPEGVRRAIGSLTISAAWDEIFLRATRTESLRRARERGVPTLHVELPPRLRIDPGHAGLPAAGVAFAALLAAALADVLPRGA
jgi:hypothetical protein